MIDKMGAFTSQFTPVEGGYLYYPSRNGGGKFVSVEEYDRLASGWRGIIGGRTTAISVVLVVLAVLLYSVASPIFVLPSWTSRIVIATCVAALVGWLLWASYAPRRLVASRPDISPPRPRGQARRRARAIVSWPMVVFALIFSGAIFSGLLMARESTAAWWAWVVGSGSMFAAYIWLGFQKLADRRR